MTSRLSARERAALRGRNAARNAGLHTTQRQDQESRALNPDDSDGLPKGWRHAVERAEAFHG